MKALQQGEGPSRDLPPVPRALNKHREDSLPALVPVAVLVQLDVLQQVELHVGWCGGGSPAVTDSS